MAGISNAPPVSLGDVSRRRLFAGAAAGGGLLVAWAVWPRRYPPNLVAAPGEAVLGPFVKIGNDGRVTVAVPQVEMGQGVYTTLPQIVADELGADWRQIGVEPAPPSPVYANTLFAAEQGGGGLFGRAPAMITGGSTSVRGYEARLRDAGALARALLCMAGAARWDADWRACDTAQGFVVHGDDRMRFGELANTAALLDAPGEVAWRVDSDNRLSGQPLPRLDLPAKIDGSANYAADVRLPGMVFAAIAQGPLGRVRLAGIDKAAAERVPGVLAVIETAHWAAAAAANWWAANRAVEAMRPRFATEGPRADDRAIARGLEAAFAQGTRIEARGDVGDTFKDAEVFTAEYRVGLAPHATVETAAATARLEGGRLELWMGTQAPAAAARAAARAIGFAPGQVTVHPMLIGGSFGARYEVEIAAQAAVLAQKLARPVQLMWSRAEEMRQDRFRPAAAARLSARIAQGRVIGWLAKIASPAAERERDARMLDGLGAAGAREKWAGRADAAAVAGAMPAYAIPNFAIDHHPADIGVATGDWRGRAHGYTAFFTECFIDELAARAGIEPFSFRMGMLGDAPRLAQCLSKAAALGGWEGPAAGQGLACHSMAGSHVAVFAEARLDADRVKVSRLIAVADCGRVINPDVVRAQIMGGLIFGMSAATCAPVRVARGRAGPERLGALGLPRMADAPEIGIELIVSGETPGGAGEVAVPPVAPAIANALFGATGRRFRTLPLAAA